jgi:hypothetical protein
MKTQRSVFLSPAAYGFALILISVQPVCPASLAQNQPASATQAPAPAGQGPGALPPTTTPAKKEPVVIPDRKLSSQGRMMLVRGMNAELGYARKPFPMGKVGLKLEAKDGKVTPDDRQLDAMMAGYGPAIKPGDRARITEVKLKDKSIIFELNGGPQKKKKWYEHIQVSGSAGTVQPGQPTDDTNVRGSYVELTFDKFVPDLTPDQIKQLLDPVLNFSAKSATEAYLETIPPKAKTAINDHRVLVGMNREMVVYAKGRPPQKHREKDGDTEYEEWIYGTPPQEVEFVRFVGDEVVRVETMQVDGAKEVRAEREITVVPEQPQVAQQQQGQGTQANGQTGQSASGDGDKGPSEPPTLRRPGEEAPNPGIGSPQQRPRQNPNPPGAGPNDGPPGQPPGN